MLVMDKVEKIYRKVGYYDGSMEELESGVYELNDGILNVLDGWRYASRICNEIKQLSVSEELYAQIRIAFDIELHKHDFFVIMQLTKENIDTYVLSNEGQEIYIFEEIAAEVANGDYSLKQNVVDLMEKAKNLYLKSITLANAVEDIGVFALQETVRCGKEDDAKEREQIALEYDDKGVLKRFFDMGDVKEIGAEEMEKILEMNF